MGYLNEDGLATLVGKVKGQVVQLTQAEYMQIPDSEKNYNNKLYFVEDEEFSWKIDDEPTLNSDGLAKSGGIYTYTSKIGSGTLTTTAQTIIPAINELNASLINKIVWHGASPLTPYKSTQANTWEDTGNTFTVPNGHLYLVALSTGWASGQPIGLGVNKGELTSAAPQVAFESTIVYKTPLIVCNSGTWSVFAKRATAGSSTNNYALEYIDIVL